MSILTTLAAIFLVLGKSHSDPSEAPSDSQKRILPRLGSFQQHLCLVNNPLLASGDFNVSRPLLAARIRKHKHLLLGVSSARCLSCCHQEEVLQALQTLQKEQTVRPPDNIAIGRIDCSEHHEWFSECETTPLPFMVYISDIKERIILRWSWPVEWVDKQLQNLRQPVVHLESEGQVAKFLKKPGDELRSRAILAVLPKEHALHSQYAKLARQNYWWLDNSFGQVSDPEVARALLQKHPEYFGEGASMTIVSMCPGNKVFPDEQVSIYRKGRLDEWFNQTYLSRPIEQYTSWTARLVSLEAPLLLLFIRSSDRSHVEFVRSLEVLAKKQLHKINFMWVETTPDSKPLLLSFGLPECTLPCVSLRSGTLTGNKIFPLEASPVQNPDWVVELVRRYFDGELIDYSEMVWTQKKAAQYVKDTFLNETELAGSVSVLRSGKSLSAKISLVLITDFTKIKDSLDRPIASLRQDENNCTRVSGDSDMPEAAFYRFNFLNRFFSQYLDVTDTRLQIFAIDTGRTDLGTISHLSLPRFDRYVVSLIVGDPQNLIKIRHSWADQFDRQDLITAAVETLLELGDSRRLQQNQEIGICDQIYLPLGLSELRHFRSSTEQTTDPSPPLTDLDSDL